MICVPVKQKKTELIIKNIKKTHNLADIIEIWFDELGKNLTQSNVDKILNSNKKPIIYKSSGNPRNIKKILKEKVSFIDLDIKTPKTIIGFIKTHFKATKIIISCHDFAKTPDTKTLKKIFTTALKKGADIVKIATYAKKIEDSFRILALLSELSQKNKVIFLCMGKYGTITRTTGHLFGNYLMYAQLTIRDKTAEGQVQAQELRKIQNLIQESCH